jgi:hypothetical protein
MSGNVSLTGNAACVDSRCSLGAGQDDAAPATAKQRVSVVTTLTKVVSRRHGTPMSRRDRMIPPTSGATATLNSNSANWVSITAKRPKPESTEAQARADCSGARWPSGWLTGGGSERGIAI